MSINNNRVAKWDNAKAILIFLVVLGHALSVVTGESSVIRSISLWLYVFHMPLFMFITGMFSKSFVNAPKIKIEKIASFLLLGMFMKVTLYLTIGIFGKWGSFNLLTEKATPWYIFVTAIHMLITYFLKKYNHKKILVASIVLALLVGYISEIGDVFIASRIFTFYPFFFLGYMLDKEKVTAFVNKGLVRALSAAFLIVFTLMLFMAGDRVYSIRYVLSGNNPYSEFGTDWAPFGIFLRGGCYLVSSLVSLAILSLIPVNKLPVITYIGTKTLTIYALHRQALYAIHSLLISPLMAIVSWQWILAIYVFVSLLLTLIMSLKPFDYIIWPFTNLKKWLGPVYKWLIK